MRPAVTDRPPAAKVEVIVNYVGSAPAWLITTVDRVRHLLSLPSDWDSYGARPVREVAVRDVLMLLQEIMPITRRLPFIAPLSDGGLQVEWSMRVIDVGFLVHPDEGATAYVLSDDVDQEWTLSGPRSISQLVAAVRALPEI